MRPKAPRGRERSGEASSPAPPAGTRPPGEDLAELRSLLLAPQQVALEDLREQVGAWRVEIQDVARVLPYAFSLVAAERRGLSSVVAPALIPGLARAARSDPGAVAKALGPALLPALRAGISESLGRVVDGVEGTLRDLFTLRPLRFRLEAWRQGKPVAEVANAHTSRFAVEEAYLLDREREAILQAATARRGDPLADGRDQDIREAAVRRAFHPSHQTQDGKRIAGVDGRWAKLVLVWRGDAPTDLVSRVSARLEGIEAAHEEAFRRKADARHFGPVLSELDDCLAWKATPRRRRPWITVGAVLLLLLLGIGALAFSAAGPRDPEPTKIVGLSTAARTAASSKADATPVAAAIPDFTSRPARATGQVPEAPWVDALGAPPRSPLDALDVSARLALGPGRAAAPWGAALEALRPAAVGARPASAHSIALPDLRSTRVGTRRRPGLSNGRMRPRAPLPDPVSTGDTPATAGAEPQTAPEPRADPLAEARRVLEVPHTVQLHLDGERLVAVGRAEHAWITRVQEAATSVDGIEHVDVRKVVDLDRKQLDRARAHLETLSILFEPASTQVSNGQAQTLDRIEADLLRVEEAGARLGLEAVVELVPSAPRVANRVLQSRAPLAHQQALVVVELLRQRGITGTRVPWPPPTAWGAAAVTPDGRTWVRLRVSLEDAAD